MKCRFSLALLTLWSLLCLLPPAHSAAVLKAVARITSADGSVSGLVHFEEESDGGVHVMADIQGLSPGLHGFHVHQFGDIREKDTLNTLGTHFIYACAPEPGDNSTCEEDNTHGFPPSEVRHPGDMGNIEATAGGSAVYDDVMRQNKMSLSSDLKSILGRAVLVHLRNDSGVAPYGNAGDPAATGVIGLENPGSDTNDAVAPNVPPVDKLMCVFDGEPAGNSILGALLIEDTFNSESMTVSINATGMQAGTYTMALYTYGDLTEEDASLFGDEWSQSDMNTKWTLEVTDNDVASGSVSYSGSFDHPASLLPAVGRGCALYEGTAEETADSFLAYGVVGLAHPDATLMTNPHVSASARTAHAPFATAASLLVALTLFAIRMVVDV